MSVDLAVAEVLAPLLIFVRLGAALVILPGFAETYVLMRFRLHFALMFSLVLALPLAPGLPPAPEDPLALLQLIGSEALIGLLIGGATRVVFAALHIAGTAIAFQSGLAGAAIFDPNEATQGTITSNFLTTVGLVLMFSSDAHHLLLRALAATYEGLPVGTSPPVGDFADLMARLLQETFVVGVKLAGPLIAVSLVMYLGMGILNRLMPAFQVFFVALPLQILLSLSLIAIVLAGSMLVFFDHFETALRQFPIGG